MSNITKFHNLCLKEDITGLNELKSSGFTIAAEQRRKAVVDNINKGNLRTIKWLFNNGTINIKKEKLLQQACLVKKFDIAEWLYNNNKISMLKFQAAMINKMKKDDDIKKWINKKVKKEKELINKFIDLCKGNDIEKIDAFFSKHKHLIDFEITDKLINNNFTIEFIKWTIINKLCTNIIPLILKSLIEDHLGVFKWFYKQFGFKFTEVMGYEKLVETLDKTKDTYKHVLECVHGEKIYNKLLKLCSSGGSLSQIQSYYLENLTHISGQIIIRSIGDLLENSRKNIIVFKWFVDIYKIKPTNLNFFLCEGIIEGNKELVDFCKNRLTVAQIKKLDIDLQVVMACEKEHYDMVEYVLDNGFRLKKHLSCVYSCLLRGKKLNLLKKIEEEYKFLREYEDFDTAFITACITSNIEIVKWLYTLHNNIFDNEFDEFYEIVVGESYQNNNIDVLRWLVGLFDRFYLITHSGRILLCDNAEDSDDDYYDSDDETPYNEIYDIILENKKQAYELLNITQTYKNTENDDCIICKDKPSDLIQLNCGHFGCINCMATWYKTNKEVCVYCKQNINWTECKKLEL